MRITTIDELIEQLGGATKVARWAGMATHAGVSLWRERGCIPPGWHLRLLAECRRRGIDVDMVAVFGLTPEEARQIERPVERPLDVA